MKYGIVVNGRVTEPVEIPNPLPVWAADVTAFLAKMFPGKTGWVAVSEDAVPGATYVGPGVSTNPAVPEGTPQRWDAYDFKMRFTVEERIAIRAASKTDAVVEDFMDMLDTAAATGTLIVANDPLLNEGLNMLVSAELLSEDRKTALLGG